MSRPIIIGENLQKVFPLQNQLVTALDNISLKIPRGEFVAIMGPSGSGKSTLLYMLGALDRPSGGHLRVAGYNLNEMTGEELADFRRRTMGFVFQSFHLIPTITALENVALPGIFNRMPSDERMERAYRLLRMLGLEHRIDHLPRQLSGGQQQRVAIARALFNNPPLIMADEPTGALDSKTGQTVLKMLRSLCDKGGKTILVVTHDPKVADYADRVMHLQDGRLIRQESKRLRE